MKLKKVIALISAAAICSTLFAGCSSSGTSSQSNGTSTGGTSAAGTSSTDWPKRTVNMICCFSAGGDTDYNSREIAKYLGQKLGQSVVVTNVTGSGGTIAATQVKNSKADGYTCLVDHAAMNVAQASGLASFGYEAFDPACIFGMGEGEAIVVRADSPWKSVKDMIADSQKNPNKYKTIVSAGATTAWVQTGMQMAGGKLTVVSGGNASDRLPQLLGGHIDYAVISVSMLKDYLKTNKLKMLAVNTPERCKDYPDVPTLKESGVDVSYNNDYTIFFPKGTDKAIIDKMNASVKDIVLNNKEYQTAIKTTYGQDPAFKDQSETLQYYKDELARLMKISDKLQGK